MVCQEVGLGGFMKRLGLIALFMVGATGWAESNVVPMNQDLAASVSGAESQPSLVVANQTANAQLRQRVESRWQALAAGDFEAAYQFGTPGYRAVYTPLQFKYQFGSQIAWRVATVKDIRYDDDDANVARVVVSVAYRYDEPEKKDYRALDGTATLNEVWLRKDEQWWYQQD